MSTHIAEAVAELEKVTADVRTVFGQLSQHQLNWKAEPKRWSIAQCLDHLIRTNSLYFTVFAQARQGSTPTFWERNSPLSGFFGRFMIRVLSPDNKRKTRTVSKSEPALGDIEEGIVERFAEHQSSLIQQLQSLTGAELDLARTIVTSPLASLVTYSLGDAITILVVHEQRHVLQAKRVMNTPGFPSR